MDVVEAQGEHLVEALRSCVDAAGDVYATGRASGTVDFDAGPGTTALSGTGFVMKLSTGDLLSLITRTV